MNTRRFCSAKLHRPVDSLRNSAEILAQTEELLKKGKDVPGFILGTGVCGYDTPPGNIMAVRETNKAMAA